MKAGKKNKAENPDGEMSLSGHLRELRNRVLICLVLLFAAMIVALGFSPKLVEMLLTLGRTNGYRFIYISPQELLIEYFSLSVIAGICMTLPMIFYQIWAFVKPGLKQGENGFFLFAMLFGLFSFCVGILFAWKVMLPFMLNFLSTLNGSSEVTAAISVQNYISFLLTIFVVFGAIFELPMVSVLLTRMGLLRSAWMKKARKPAIVVIFFLAAVVTPPDVVSQTMVAIPVILLYQLSILLCSFIERKK